MWWLSEMGHADRAVDEARARTDADIPNMRRCLARLLTRTGRLDEAIETLTPSRYEWDVATLASLLVRVGRVQEAVTTWHERDVTPDPALLGRLVRSVDDARSDPRKPQFPRRPGPTTGPLRPIGAATVRPSGVTGARGTARPCRRGPGSPP